MSTRVAIIGNSHAAAFKTGWDVIKDEYPHVEAVVFSSPATSMRLFKVEDGAIVPMREDVRNSIKWTSGGLDRIPGDMDAYVLVGMSFSYPHLMAVLRTHRPPESYDPKGNHQLISEAVFMATIRQLLKVNGAKTNIENVRAITDAPLIYSPNPFSSEAVLKDPDFAFWHCQATRHRLFKIYLRAVQNLREKCTLVEQPPETISNRYFTKAEFTRNSMKLRQAGPMKHADNDHGHMNAEFGAMCLRDIFDNYLRIGRDAGVRKRASAPAS